MYLCSYPLKWVGIRVPKWEPNYNLLWCFWIFCEINNQTHNSHTPFFIISLSLPLSLSNRVFFNTTSTGSELQIPWAPAATDTKQTTQSCMCVSVCASLFVYIYDLCCDLWVIAEKGEWEGRPAGEGGGSECENCVVMAAYKWSYYITEAWSEAAARRRAAKANRRHSGEQPTHTSVPGAAT